MEDEARYSIERKRMVAEQIRRRGIPNEPLLEAMESIPRHRFIPPAERRLAYVDAPVSIGNGQTISQPYIVALMTALLRLEGGEKVLEIGTGSGYQAAILGRLAAEVHTIERYADLAARASQVLNELGAANVHVHVGDGSLGLPAEAPFDAILVTAAAPAAQPALLQQLKDGGRLVIPVGGQGMQYLERWERSSDRFDQERLVPVAFVPLRGQLGWTDESWGAIDDFWAEAE